jgi:hypothetical protein
MALTQEQIEKLKEDDSLRCTTHTGYGKNHIDANVKVVAIGPHGLSVEVIEVFSKGKDNKNCEGARFFATFDELSVLPK